MSVSGVSWPGLTNVSSGRGLTTSGARDLEADTKFIKYFKKDDYCHEIEGTNSCIWLRIDCKLKWPEYNSKEEY